MIRQWPIHLHEDSSYNTSASLKASHEANITKNTYIMWLRFPTGRRQTSWLFRKHERGNEEEKFNLQRIHLKAACVIERRA